MNRLDENITLEGEHVRLIPMEAEHREAMLQAASDGRLWELWYTTVPSEESIDEYIRNTLDKRTSGIEYPFVVVHKATGAIIGSTRYYNIEPHNRRLEIGYTWYAKSYQRSAVNTECKYLLLNYAFEQLNCIAVQFMTHERNERSRNAILRLGAKQDGILRNHRILQDGSIRNSVVYSITADEWPEIKTRLLSRLNA